jgi:hypothetical protein
MNAPVQTVGEARDLFVAMMRQMDIPPEPVAFVSDEPWNWEGLPRLMRDVTVNGWSIVPNYPIAYWDADRLAGVRDPERAIVMKGVGEKGMVVDVGATIVVTSDGRCFNRIQPGWLEAAGGTTGPVDQIDDGRDDQDVIAALVWGAEWHRVQAEQLRCDAIALAEGLLEFRSVVEELGLPPAEHHFSFWFLGAQPDNGQVMFCDPSRQVTVTRVPAAMLPTVTGWVVSEGKPDDIYCPRYVVTPDGLVVPLDVDGETEDLLAVPDPIPTEINSGDDYVVCADFLSALLATVEGLHLERAVGETRDRRHLDDDSVPDQPA